MSEAGKLAINASPEFSNSPRAYAVAAAVELIAIRMQSASSATQLEYEMDKLSTYADQIEAAMNKA